MKLNFSRIAACILALHLASPANSAPLRIETIQGPPWGFIGSDGKVTGMMVDIGNLIAQEAGLSATNTLAPYARTAVDIENGSADIVLRFANDQMIGAAIPVATIVSMPIIVLGPRGTRFNSLGDLHGKVVGYVRTGKFAEQFDSSTSIKKYPVNDYEVMAKMLALRRLDAGIGSNVGIYYGASIAGIKPEQLGEPLVVGHKEFILFLSKKTATPEMVSALRAAVGRLTANGKIQQVIDRYTRELNVKLPQK